MNSTIVKMLYLRFTYLVCERKVTKTIIQFLHTQLGKAKTQGYEFLMIFLCYGGVLCLKI